MKKSVILWTLSVPLLLLTACGPQPKAELNVMTFNMRYDNPHDSANNWQFRRDRVARVIESQSIDIFGAQELLINHLNDLKGLLPGYAEVGVGRDDGAEAGEFNPVFYRADRFEPARLGDLLVERDSRAGGLEGVGRRLQPAGDLDSAPVTATAANSFLINTHLDHVGETARREGVSLLLERIARLSAGRPVVLTGDFNAEPESAVIAHVTESGLLHHTRDAAAECQGPN